MEQRNLFLAIALSLAILIGFQFLYPGPETPSPESQTTAQNQPPAAPAATPGAPAPTAAAEAAATRAEAIGRTARATIDTPRLRGSIALAGGRIDDLWLRDYCETQDPSSHQV